MNPNTEPFAEDEPRVVRTADGRVRSVTYRMPDGGILHFDYAVIPICIPTDDYNQLRKDHTQ